MNLTDFFPFSKVDASVKVLKKLRNKEKGWLKQREALAAFKTLNKRNRSENIRLNKWNKVKQRTNAP